jgi:hypothetical protein
MQGSPWPTGDGGRETGEKLVQRSCDDPPFVSVDAAENFDSHGKVVCLRGQLKNISSESLKTQFGDFSLHFC